MVVVGRDLSMLSTFTCSSPNLDATTLERRARVIQSAIPPRMREKKIKRDIKTRTATVDLDITCVDVLRRDGEKDGELVSEAEPDD